MNNGNKQYIGITIGPILDTLLLAHSPAAMWYASFMFSSLTEAICEEIRQAAPLCRFLSPYYDGGERYTDGIGRYHDRIIVETDDEVLIKTAIDAAVTRISDRVIEDLNPQDAQSTRTFLHRFFQIHYVILQDEAAGGAFKPLSDQLDMLEKMPSPNADSTANPFLSLFRGKDRFRNAYVRAALKDSGFSTQLLSADGKLRSIEDIAGKSKGLKHSDYYAVVEADGDGMGSYLQSLGDEGIADFSKRCFDYAGKAAALIGEFGGMTVYAGGDDLLFIAPIRSEKGTVFDLCRDIRELFSEVVTEGKDAPAISFGIAVRFKHFPLYEALDSSLSALFAAKQYALRQEGETHTEKDCMVIDFQKHSGQAMKLAVPREAFADFNEMLSLYKVPAAEASQAEPELHSVIFMLDEKRRLFESAQTAAACENIFRNAHENPSHERFEQFIGKVSGLLLRFREDHTKTAEKPRIITLIDGPKEDRDHYLKTFEMILRLSKFMIEASGRKEASDLGKASDPTDPD